MASTVSYTGGLRVLVACESCNRQYDTCNFKAGSRFHCTCGTVVTVQAVRARDVAVVRCSSCGAARQEKEDACLYCGSAFTLVEQDLHTVCPQCMARISDRAKFCHFCATPIAPQGSAGDCTDFACPACGDERKLTSRSLGKDRLSVLECGSCAGLWLDSKVFQLLQERALEASTSGDLFEHERQRGHLDQPKDRHGRFYRPCPVCSILMHRRNYGRRSGVLVDTCKAHGIWFDLGELETILRWIKSGGLARAQQLETKRLHRQQRLKQEVTKTHDHWSKSSYGTGTGDLIHAIVDFFFK